MFLHRQLLENMGFGETQTLLRSQWSSLANTMEEPHRVRPSLYPSCWVDLSGKTPKVGVRFSHLPKQILEPSASPKAGNRMTTTFHMITDTEQVKTCLCSPLLPPVYDDTCSRVKASWKTESTRTVSTGV